MGEIRHFEFGVKVDRSVYYRNHVDYPPNGVCLGSRDLSKFWQMSDNISETVQDRDIVTMEDE